MIHIQGQVTSGWGLVSAEVATNGGRWIFRKTCFRRMNKQWFIGVNSVVLNLRTPAVVVPRVLAPFIETGGRRHQRSPVVWSRSPLQSRRQTALPLSLFLVYVRGTTILIIHANIRALWFCSYFAFPQSVRPEPSQISGRHTVRQAPVVPMFIARIVSLIPSTEPFVRGMYNVSTVKSPITTSKSKDDTERRHHY